nr:hypothetical protein [Tanacetum cinerariifolium]
MKVTQLDIPTHQLNIKFANNLPSYWGKYVSHAKNNMNMSTVTYVELFTHLRTYEEHALKSLKKKEQSSAVVDPLTYLAKTIPTHSTTSPVTVPTPQSSVDLYNDAMLSTMNQIANLLSGLQKQRAPGNTGTKGIQTTGSGVNNSGKKVICYNCHGEGHVARQCKDPKRARDSQWYHDKAFLMQAKEKGAMLDAKAEAFLADLEYTAPYDQPLALTTTNLFEANHEDAYDSDVDEGPHASAAFMANLSSTDGTNGSSSSHINEEEHLNSKVDSVLDDNMITYDEYQNDSRVEVVPTVVSANEADKQSMIAILQHMHTEIAGYVRVNDEHKLVNATLTAELEWCKIEMQTLERKPHGKLIWKSIQNGPTPHPQTTDPAPEGGAVPPSRNKRDEEFTEEDNRNELADIQAISSGQTLELQKEALFDEFERFRANGNELIQDYFVRFHKLIDTEMVQRRALGNTGTKGIQTTGSGVNNSGKKVICYNYRGEGHVARQCKESKRARDSQWYHDKALLMQAKEKGAVLDAKAEAFLADVECAAPYDQPLALTTTNLFEANHEDAYDSDVDEGPHAFAAFMANLSSTGGINGSSSSHINEQNDSGVEAVPSVALKRNKVKHDLDMAIVKRNKRNAELEEENAMLKSNLKSKVVSIENLQQESKQVLSEKKTLEDKYLEGIVVLTNANKVATNVLKGFQMPTHTISMLSKRPNFASHDLHKTGLGYSNP